MAHITQMAEAISNYDKRKAIQAVMEKPMPKLGIAYLPANAVETSYELLDVLNYKEALEGVDPHGYTKASSRKHYGDLYPVTVRIFNLNAALNVTQANYTDEQGRLDEKAWDAKRREVVKLSSEMHTDLMKLGSRAFNYNHHYNHPQWSLPADERDKVRTETHECLALPCSYPTTETQTTGYEDNPHWQKLHRDMPSQSFERDIRGAGIFLAYLMAKQLITPDEIETAYGHGFLEEACKRENAQLLKERLGLEMPLPTASHHTDRDKGEALLR